MIMQNLSIIDLVQKEDERQKNTIRLIASENFVSQDILKVLGSSLTNKYSEGYPYKRYYRGQEFIDQIEQQTIDLARKVFGASFANVQAYSGSPANLAIYMALLNPYDTVMGLDLSSGGHLTHGFKVSITGKWFDSKPYSVSPDTFLIDYDNLEKLAVQYKPKLIISGLSAYPREIDFAKIGAIAKKVGAYHLADISHISGLILTQNHPNPFPYADIVMTTTHKMLRGPRGALILTNDKILADKIDKSVFPGLQGGPHINNIAGIGIALEEALSSEYRDYIQSLLDNAKSLSNELVKLGFNVITGGTDNHLLLLDLRKNNIDGETFSQSLEKANIETNKNSIPFDTAPPTKTNGLRIGTPAITTIGMKPSDMIFIANSIKKVLDNYKDESILKEIKEENINFLSKFKL